MLLLSLAQKQVNSKTEIVKVNNSFIKKIAARAQKSPRQRINYNFHSDYRSKVQRFLNIINPASYIRPHKHENPNRFEVFILLKGKAVMVIYNDQGKVIDYFTLNSAKGNFAIEIPAQAWHSLIALEKNTCLYEVKPGPYLPKKDKIFAPWSPEEGTKKAGIFNRNLRRLFAEYR